MAKLVLVRHGQSQWNLENKFTGWVDVDLSEYGKEEAKQAGAHLKNTHFDVAFTSVLQRAINTLNIILKETGQEKITVFEDDALNERNYGDLQGKDKTEMEEIAGKEQVHLWRRSYDVAPPNGESLKDTKERVIPYYEDNILPYLQEGKNVLVVAHGNSLRALTMYLEGLSPEEITHLNIPTGKPVLYEFDPAMKLTDKEVI